MNIICCDLEGVFTPEIWINVAKKTGVEELKLTTRDIPDYDVLMQKRLGLLKQHGLKIQDIKDVIATMEPLDGANDFLTWMRENYPVIIVSDTFVQFAGPLMKKLGMPTLFCNSLVIADNGEITGYQLRQKDGKRKTVIALKSLNFKIVACGDSYNDISMLKESDKGILFCPPDSVKQEYPQFKVTLNYAELKKEILDAISYLK
ncbi:MAG: bifunctional phosphoserine phosphatase/homoserine phosphotransferase ThrH [Desulfobacterales bacterium]|nr:bifunctional phosphoserine phosphatase/homoserine phosphotransferase ThrH [Desulfobacterales bacterium]